MPRAQHQLSHPLPMAIEIRRYGRCIGGSFARVGNREYLFEEKVYRRIAQSWNHSGGDGKEGVKPSLCKKVVYEAIKQKAVSIRFVCHAFQISETYCRYEHLSEDRHTLIADWPIKLTDEHHDWDFGLCFASIRHGKGLKLNLKNRHKTLYIERYICTVRHGLLNQYLFNNLNAIED